MEASRMAATCWIATRFCLAARCCCRRNSAAATADDCGMNVILVRGACSVLGCSCVLGLRQSGLELIVAGFNGPTCCSGSACCRCCCSSCRNFAISSSTLSLSTRRLLRGARGWVDRGILIFWFSQLSLISTFTNVVLSWLVVCEGHLAGCDALQSSDWCF